MKRSEDRDERRPKKRSKKRKSAEAASRRRPLLIGGAVAGVVVLGLVVWGIVRLLSPGGLYGPVVADARPVGQVMIRINPSPDVLPAVHIPSASDGWKLTPDAVPSASGLASAVVLPDGQPMALLFADPARAKAAVLLAKVAVQPKEGVPLAVLEKSVNIHRFPDGNVLFGGAPNLKANMSLIWAQIDLKAGAVVAQTPLGTYEVVSNREGRFPTPLTTTALSPSGDRLAAVVPQNNESLLVWDAAGKVVRSWDAPQVFAGRWIAFVTEDRLLSHGAAKVSALDVASGQVAFASAEAATPPFALSPGRKWLGALDPAGGLKVFHTADGTVAGTTAKPVEKGTPATLAFHPDGATVTATTLRRALWLNPKHLVVEDTLFDLDGNVALWKYPPQTGSGSVELKKQTAEGAAAALAKQGQAVDPEAKVGVRIELSAPKSVTVVSRPPGATPGLDINPKFGRPGYQISYKVYFFDRESGVVSPPVTTHEPYGFADNEGRLDAFYNYIGGRAAEFGGPLGGLWDGEGQIQTLGTTTLGIDGVLEP